MRSRRLAIFVVTVSICSAGCDVFIKRPPTGARLQMVPVEFGKISTQDSWILNYDISVAKIEGVRTSSNYLLVTIGPKRDRPVASVPSPTGRFFELTGYASSSPSEVGLTLDNSDLNPANNWKAVIILDMLATIPPPDVAGRKMILNSQNDN